ncbi:MAG: calcium/sodium antiporter [Saprospiraceae bacterium]
MEDILLYFGIFILALGLLLKGSDWFVDAAEEVGLSWGISPFIIGVTIVAFGTSLPELAASIVAVLEGDEGIVVGGAVGSNITNICLVLAVVAIYAKELKIDHSIMNIDMPYLIGSSFILYFILRDLVISIPEALFLFGGIVTFLVYSFKVDEDDLELKKTKTSIKSYLMILVGGISVYFGADYTVFSIAELSKIAGIDQEIIALTLVAFGTSLPELMVSISAARRGKTELAVGNVLGSNIFNTYVVLSIPNFFGTVAVGQSFVSFSVPFMVAITVLFYVMCHSGKISRWEGLTLLAFYGFFILELSKGYL